MELSDIKKGEIEKQIGFEISDEGFREALGYAKRKQAYIYAREQRAVVMEHWYLVTLTAEYVKSLNFSKYCTMLNDMKKEHQLKQTGTPNDNHIVAFSVI